MNVVADFSLIEQNYFKTIAFFTFTIKTDKLDHKSS